MLVPLHRKCPTTDRNRSNAAWSVELSDQAQGSVAADAVYVVREDAPADRFTWTPAIPTA